MIVIVGSKNLINDKLLSLDSLNTLTSVLRFQISPDGSMAATVSQEKTCKVFDVVNFDMINMLKLDFVPVCCGWIFQRSVERIAKRTKMFQFCLI